MLPLRKLPLPAFVTATLWLASAHGQEGAAATSTDAAVPPSAAGEADEQNTERVRKEFVEVRDEYADLLASVLPREELTRRLRPLAARVHLRDAEKVFGSLRASLKAVEATYGPASAAARPLAEEAARLGDEVKRLREADSAEKWPVGWGDRVPGDEEIGRWFDQYMENETRHLARTLPTDELERRTGRLRPVVDLARAAALLRQIEALRRPLGGEDAPADGPAGAALEVTDRAGELRREVGELLKTLYDVEEEDDQAAGPRVQTPLEGDWISVSVNGRPVATPAGAIKMSVRGESVRVKTTSAPGHSQLVRPATIFGLNAERGEVRFATPSGAVGTPPVRLTAGKGRLTLTAPSGMSPWNFFDPTAGEEMTVEFERASDARIEIVPSDVP